MWPASSRLPKRIGELTLLVIAHPRCSCTRATLGELARIMSRADHGLSACVVFALPAGRDSSWIEADLWRAASSIPGARVFVDQDGAEARRFGTATSGQTLLYDGRGRLRFAGGITPGRGHAGDNAGADAVVAAANAGTMTATARASDRDAGGRSETPVFGCALATTSGAGSRRCIQ